MRLGAATACALPRRTAVCLAPLLFLAVLFAACKSLHAQQPPVPLAGAAAALPTVDLVLAHYNEPLAEVVAFVQRANASLPHARLARVFLYTHHATTLNVSVVPHDWAVFTGVNVGRESHIYLEFIVRHWHDVSDFVWFSQAVPDFYMDERLWPRLPLLTARTGMLGLARIEPVSCNGIGQGWYNPYFGSMLSQLWAISFHEFCHDRYWVAFFNGEFVVSARRLRGQPRALWAYLRDVVAQPDGAWPHAALEQEREKSTATGPTFGHIMERAWSILFRCVPTKLQCCEADKPCEPDWCQCLDEPGDGEALARLRARAAAVANSSFFPLGLRFSAADGANPALPPETSSWEQQPGL